MYLKILATPSARKERVEEMENGILHISVREPASQNHANTRVRQIIAERLQVPVSQVRILTGHR